MFYRKRKNKYNAVKTKIGDLSFDSRKEAVRYQELLHLEKTGEIFDLEIHPKYVLAVNDCKICSYIGDFQYHTKGGALVVEDVKGGGRKGTLTPAARLKHKMMLAIHGIEVRIV